MPAPVLTGPALRLYEWLEPWARDDENRGHGMAWLAAALGAQLEHLDQVVSVSPSGLPGWARLANVTDEDDCPDFAVPFMAQVAGAILDDGLPVSDQRALLRPDATKRASDDAIVAAVKPLLTGTRTVRYVRRLDGNAYHHQVITRTDETPDPDAVVAKLADPYVKPVGHKLFHVVSDLPLINEGTLDIDDVTGVDIDDATLADIT